MMPPVAVYRCYDADDRLLYVGVSNKPETRVKIHKGQGAKWAQRVARVDHEWYDNRCDALIAERRATLTEHPEVPTTVLGPHIAASAMSGLISDYRIAGYGYGRRDLAQRDLDESGYLDNTTVTPRSQPIPDDAAWEALIAGGLLS